MGKVLERIDGRLRTFIEAQPVFFVGTAPSGTEGHVNVSPKGLADTFTVVDEHTVAYLDLTASGAETIAHLRDNGRIVLMFCSFERSPTIVRLHGEGAVVSVYDPDFPTWSSLFPANPIARAVIVVRVTRVSTSCGWSLPVFGPATERDLLTGYMERRGPEELQRFRRAKNTVSIDGLPAYDDDPDPDVVPVPAGA